MKLKKYLLFCVYLLLIIDTVESVKAGDRGIAYNLSSPDKVLILPDILHEVSGLTYIDSCNAGIPMPPEARRIIMGKAIQPRVANASKT